MNFFLKIEKYYLIVSLIYYWYNGVNIKLLMFSTDVIVDLVRIEYYICNIFFFYWN